MKNVLLTLCLLLALSSCGHKDKNEVVADMVKFSPPVVKTDAEVMEKNISEAKDMAVDVSPVKNYTGNANADERISAPSSATGAQIRDTSKKIIKEGDISFETVNVNETRKKIIHSLERLGGYVDEDNQSLNNDDNRKEYTLKIRVPAKNFDFFLDSVSAAADKIDEKNISVTDVTTRFIDVTTRLANKKLLENSYLDLLKKSSKISDLLEIENKLSEIRSDIESTQGQLNYLNKQIAYSSLSITFYTKQTAVEDKGEGFGFKLKDSIKDGTDLVQKLFFGFIGIWPVWITVIAIYLFFKARKKRRSQKAV